MKDFKIISDIDNEHPPSTTEALEIFFKSAITVKQIQIAHISIYAVLVKIWGTQLLQNPFKITRTEVMHLAKIGSKTTYHKCIKDLQAVGYISYKPSYHPSGKSEIFMLKIS